MSFVNFYQCFIKGFSNVIKPLVALIQKEQLFLWTKACQSAFELLKQQVMSASVLQHFNPNQQAILETDILEYVIRGVLSQYNNYDVLHPVAFYSKNLVPAECNYHIYDKELLAIIQCFEHWCPELEHIDLPVQIFTDHQALKTFMESKQLSCQQAWYLDFLTKFNFQIIFCSDKKNTKADTLTQRSDSQPVDDSDECCWSQYQTILTSDRVDI